MGINADEQWAVDAALLAVAANGLADRQHMRFIKGLVEGRTTMARGTEGDPLQGVGGIGRFAVIGRDEPGNVDQQLGWRRLSGQWADFLGGGACLAHFVAPGENAMAGGVAGHLDQASQRRLSAFTKGVRRVRLQSQRADRSTIL